MADQLIVELAASSETGPVRSSNEDHLGWGRLGRAPFCVAQPAAASATDLREEADRGWLFAVADGLGSYGGGDVASRLAVTTLLERAASDPGAAPSSLLRSGFEAANRVVFDAAMAGQGTRKMQTTTSALLVTPGEAHLGHVGDCRIYRLRDQLLELLTTDHSQAMEMLRLRLITPEQAADHPGRAALTRSVGGDITVRTDIRQLGLEPDDTFLLCSDGLWGKVGAAEIREALAGSPAAACRWLIERAVERGGEDNATAMIVRVREPGQRSERPQRWRRFFLS